MNLLVLTSQNQVLLAGLLCSEVLKINSYLHWALLKPSTHSSEYCILNFKLTNSTQKSKH